MRGTLDTDDLRQSQEILEKFDNLPKLWRGKEIVVEFVNNRSFSAASTDTVSALDLESRIGTLRTR